MTHNKIVAGITSLIVALSFVGSAIGPLRPAMTVLGIVLVASAGYVLVEVLIRSAIPRLERVFVTAGFALLVPLIGGLLLSAMGVLLRRTAWLEWLAAVILLCDVVLLVRTRTDSADVVTPSYVVARPSQRPTGMSMRLTVAFGIAAVIAGVAVGLARVGVAMQRYPGFTQLWLSPSAGSTSVANLGVTNDQGSTTRYRLVLLRNDHSAVSWNITLTNGQTWLRDIEVPDRLTTLAILYRLPDTIHPFRQVSLHS